MTETTVPEILRESLSALVDDQATDFELQRILRESEHNDEIRQTWSRYQLISTAIRQESPAGQFVDISAAVRSAIEADDIGVQLSEPEGNVSRWNFGWGRMAIAASVAAVVVMTSQLVMTPSGGGTVQPVVATESRSMPSAVPANSVPSGFVMPELSARTVSNQQRMEQPQASRALPQIVIPSQLAPVSQQPSPAAQQYLHQVLQQHAANSVMVGSQGVLPYARVPSSAE